MEADTHKFEVRTARLSSLPAAAFADASSAGVKAFCIQHGGLDGLLPEDWMTRIWFFRVGGDELLEPKLVSLCRRGDWSSSVLHASPGRRVVVGAWPMGGLSCPPCVAALRRPAPDHVRAAGAVFTWAVLWFLVAPASEEASWCCDLSARYWAYNVLYPRGRAASLPAVLGLGQACNLRRWTAEVPPTETDSCLLLLAFLVLLSSSCCCRSGLWWRSLVWLWS